MGTREKIGYTNQWHFFTVVALFCCCKMSNKISKMQWKSVIRLLYDKKLWVITPNGIWNLKIWNRQKDDYSGIMLMLMLILILWVKLYFTASFCPFKCCQWAQLWKCVIKTVFEPISKQNLGNILKTVRETTFLTFDVSCFKLILARAIFSFMARDKKWDMFLSRFQFYDAVYSFPSEFIFETQDFIHFWNLHENKK